MLAAVECSVLSVGFWQPPGLLVGFTRARGECGDAVKCSATLAAPVRELAASQPPCFWARRQGMAQACTARVVVMSWSAPKTATPSVFVPVQSVRSLALAIYMDVHTWSSRPSYTLGKSWLPPAHRPGTCRALIVSGGRSGMHLAAVEVCPVHQELWWPYGCDYSAFLWVRAVGLAWDRPMMLMCSSGGSASFACWLVGLVVRLDGNACQTTRMPCLVWPRANFTRCCLSMRVCLRHSAEEEAWLSVVTCKVRNVSCTRRLREGRTMYEQLEHRAALVPHKALGQSTADTLWACVNSSL